MLGKEENELQIIECAGRESRQMHISFTQQNYVPLHVSYKYFSAFSRKHTPNVNLCQTLGEKDFRKSNRK